MHIHGYEVQLTYWKLIWPESSVVEAEVVKVEVPKAQVVPPKGLMATFMSLFRAAPVGVVAVPERVMPSMPKLDMNCITIECDGQAFDTIGAMHDVVIEGHVFLGLKATAKTPVDWQTGLMIVTCKCSDYFELTEEELERIPK